MVVSRYDTRYREEDLWYITTGSFESHLADFEQSTGSRWL